MAKFKQSLRNLHNTLSVFIQFITGREEFPEKQTAPTQRDQYFT